MGGVVWGGVVPFVNSIVTQNSLSASEIKDIIKNEIRSSFANIEKRNQDKLD